MILALIFWATLAVSYVYVAWAGERDEKICISAYAAASIVSTYAISPMPVRLQSMEWAMFAVDVLLLFVFLVFVVCSKRYWPLWTTGLQVVSLVGYSAVMSRVRPWTGGMTLGIIAYAILATIVIGARRSSARRHSIRTLSSASPDSC